MTVAQITIITTPSASEYEWDIYAAYPSYFWPSIIVSAFTGQAIVIIHRFAGLEDRLWKFGLLLIILSTITLLLVPWARGYPIYGRHDVLTHIGFVRDIINSGHIGSLNAYPADHLLLFASIAIAEINLYGASHTIYILFSLYFIAFFYIVARRLFKEDSIVAFSVMIAALLIFGLSHLSFAPYNQSIMVLPFVIYLFLRSQSLGEVCYGFSIALILVITFSVFLHPLMALIVAIIILVGSISIIREMKSNEEMHNRKYFSPLFQISLLLIISFMWYSNMRSIINYSRQVYGWLTGIALDSEFLKYSQLIERGNLSASVIAETVVNQYGHWIVITGLSLFFLFYMIKNANRNGHMLFSHLFAILGFLTFSCISVASLFTPRFGFGFGRIFVVALVFSFLLIGIGLHLISSRPRENAKNAALACLRRILVISIVIFFLTTITVLNLYPSPNQRTGNAQVTHIELVGMKTFFEQRDESIPILDVGVNHFRFFDALYGPSHVPRSSISVGEKALPPYHFGYNTSSTMGSLFDESHYMLLNKYGREYSQVLYPGFEDYTRFTREDLAKIENDRTVHRIYSNGNLEAFVIQPI